MSTPSKYTLAELTKGLDVAIKGKTDCLIEGVCTIQEAKPGHITFLTNPLYKKFLPSTEATAVILSQEEVSSCNVTAVITSNPYYVYSKVAAYFDDHPKSSPGIHPSAVIGKNCQIPASVKIGAHTVIGEGVKLGEHVNIKSGCSIGEYSEINDDTHIDANVTIYHRVKIGKRVMISSGVVIGSDGFGLAKHQGKWHKVPQLGSVIIEDDVEIGANCAIDRGAIGDTLIEKGVKLDNLIQVGHNVRIGENTAIAGHVAIAGSTTIGKNCLVGGCAGFAGHLTISDNVMITGMTAVTKSIREPGVYSSGLGGVVTNAEWRKNSARFHRLEHLTERVKWLEKKLAEINGVNLD